MNRLKKSKVLLLVFDVVFSVLAVAGVPLIVLSDGNTLMLVLGIVFLVCGFYGLPFAWMAYGNKRTRLRILQAINNENLYTVTELSQQLGLDKLVVLDHIRVLINRNYLNDYLLKDNEVLVLNENVKLEKSLHSIVCPSCGAKTPVVGQQALCPYCGTVLKR